MTYETEGGYLPLRTCDLQKNIYLSIMYSNDHAGRQRTSVNTDSHSCLVFNLTNNVRQIRKGRADNISSASL